MNKVPIEQLNSEQCALFLQHLGLPDRRTNWIKKGIRPLDGKLLSLLKNEYDLEDFYPKKKVPRLVLREVVSRLMEEFIPFGVQPTLLQPLDAPRYALVPLIEPKHTAKVLQLQQQLNLPAANNQSVATAESDTLLNYFQTENEQFETLVSNKKRQNELDHELPTKRSVDNSTFASPAKKKKKVVTIAVPESDNMKDVNDSCGNSEAKYLDHTVDNAVKLSQLKLGSQISNQDVLRRMKKCDNSDHVIEYLQFLVLRLQGYPKSSAHAIESMTKDKGYLIVLEIMGKEKFVDQVELQETAQQCLVLYLKQIHITNAKLSGLSISVVLLETLDFLLGRDTLDGVFTPLVIQFCKIIEKLVQDKNLNIAEDFRRRHGDEKLKLLTKQYHSTGNATVSMSKATNHQVAAAKSSQASASTVDDEVLEVQEDTQSLLMKLAAATNSLKTANKLLDTIFARLQSKSKLSVALDIVVNQGYLQLLTFIRSLPPTATQQEATVAVVRRASEVYLLWIDVMKMTKAQNQYDICMHILNVLVCAKHEKEIQLLEQVMEGTIAATEEYLQHYPSYRLRFQQELGAEKLEKLKSLLFQVL